MQLHAAVRQRTDRIAELEQRDDDLTAQNAALRRDNESLRDKVIFLKGKEERKSDRIDGSKDDLSDRAVTRALAESRAECKEMQLAMNAGKIARQRLLAKLDALGRERDQFQSKVQELRSALTDLTGHRDKALEFAAALRDTMKDHAVSLQELRKSDGAQRMMLKKMGETFTELLESKQVLEGSMRVFFIGCRVS